ncbi:diguanylate cyclase [Lysobacter koreensis]|uniref:diguanylate cyclase n=2 Tax=Lysobacter koreensis TaxID=266122 RepID=A0ABW2YME7_9GAMM
MPPFSRLRPYRSPALALAIVLLIGVGVATIWSIRGFSRGTEWLEHTYQVIARIEATESAVRTAESTARAYRLTDNPQQQAEYLAAVPVALQHAADLVALTVDNRGQHQRARQLQQRVQARLGEIARLVELQNRQGAEQARVATLTSSGIGLMQGITVLAGEMRHVEQQLLAQRRVAIAGRASLLTGFIVLGIVLPMVLLGLLLRGLARENLRSRELEREARNAMQALENAAVVSGRLSEQRRALGIYAGLLQSCESLPEAMQVTAQVIGQLLPNAGGRCYAMRASENIAETAARFGWESVASAGRLEPSDCWALRRGQPHRVGAGHGHVVCAHLQFADAPPDAWALCLPLAAQGTALGLLHLNGAQPLGTEDVGVIEAVAEQLSLAMANLQLRETLRVQSLRDPLTGLFNRRFLEENLQRELLRCERRGLPLSVLMIDVDHFKRFNDEYGHAAGDALLAAIGATLRASTRGEDLACRYGGEEFTVVLPEIGREAALQRGEEIRLAIAATTAAHMGRTVGPTTASLGIASFPADAAAPDTLLDRADTALYRAKANGRDRIELARAGDARSASPADAVLQSR